MINFNTYILFENILNNETISSELIEAGLLNLGLGKQNVMPMDRKPTPIADEKRQKYRQELLKDRPKRISIQDIIQDDNKKQKLIDILEPLKEKYKEIEDLITAIELEM